MAANGWGVAVGEGDRDVGVGEKHGRSKELGARKDTGLASDKRGGEAGVSRDQRLGGEVTPGGIFVKGLADETVDGLLWEARWGGDDHWLLTRDANGLEMSFRTRNGSLRSLRVRHPWSPYGGAPKLIRV